MSVTEVLGATVPVELDVVAVVVANPVVVVQIFSTVLLVWSPDPSVNVATIESVPATVSP